MDRYQPHRSLRLWPARARIVTLGFAQLYKVVHHNAFSVKTELDSPSSQVQLVGAALSP